MECISYDECGVCDGGGAIDDFCVCSDLPMNSIHLVEGTIETCNDGSTCGAIIDGLCNDAEKCDVLHVISAYYKIDVPIYGLQLEFNSIDCDCNANLSLGNALPSIKIL